MRQTCPLRPFFIILGEICLGGKLLLVKYVFVFQWKQRWGVVTKLSPAAGKIQLLLGQ